MIQKEIITINNNNNNYQSIKHYSIKIHNKYSKSNDKKKKCFKNCLLYYKNKKQMDYIKVRS